MIHLFFFVVVTLTQAKSHYETKVMYSQILQKEVKYNVHYPPEYTEEKKYPILYGLHGMGWNYTYFNMSQPYFDQALDTKIIDPFLTMLNSLPKDSAHTCANQSVMYLNLLE